MTNNIIELVNITKTYQTEINKFQALKWINLNISCGEFVSITGRSGCGKTTLLNILGCMDRPSNGKYLFNGMDVLFLSKNEVSKFRNKQIGFIFQAFNLINEISALENVSLPLGYGGVSSRERRSAAQNALDRVGLSDKLKSKPYQMSGGEQQRVAIARAIVNNPQMLLADEPTGNLDDENSETIMKILCELNDAGVTIVMVTHSQVMASYAQKQIKMANGMIIEA